VSRPAPVEVFWTATARDALRRLPKRVQQGLLSKVDELRTPDAWRLHKPLIGPLQGFRRLSYARYRAVYSVTEHKQPDGKIVIRIVITVVAVGIRKQRSKEDIYQLCERLIRLGLLRIEPPDTPGGGKRTRK
jgi:mRNA interferase RelE/StbE